MTTVRRVRRNLALIAVAVVLTAGGVTAAVAVTGENAPEGKSGSTVESWTVSEVGGCTFTESQGEVTSNC
jgi:hypothetical protein